jgi:hypothetical protein
VIEEELQRRLGRETDPSRYPAPEGMSAEAWRRYVAAVRPGVLLHVFGDAGGALSAVHERLSLAGSGPDADFWIETVYIARAGGDEALAEEALERARELEPGHPALRDLETG